MPHTAWTEPAKCLHAFLSAKLLWIALHHMLDVEMTDCMRPSGLTSAHLDELTQVSKPRLLSIRNLSNEDENAVHDGLLVLKPAVLSQDAR